MRYRIFLDSTDVCVYIHTKCITMNFMNGNGIRQPTTEIVYNLILYISMQLHMDRVIPSGEV